MPIYKLSKGSILFPPSAFADFDGLLAFGGDLSVDRLVEAYSNGIFPWYNPGEEILWWCPRERFLIFPKEIRVSKSMKKVLKKGELKVKFNENFAQIIAACRAEREGDTWIGDDMQAAYNAMFEAGYAGCAGVYDEDERPVGGLYGVVLGRCFFGESMFSLKENASKIALICLCEYLAEKGFLFIDCQFHTPHLETMGGRYVPWNIYRRMLREGTRTEQL